MHILSSNKTHFALQSITTNIMTDNDMTVDYYFEVRKWITDNSSLVLGQSLELWSESATFAVDGVGWGYAVFLHVYCLLGWRRPTQLDLIVCYNLHYTAYPPYTACVSFFSHSLKSKFISTKVLYKSKFAVNWRNYLKILSSKLRHPLPPAPRWGSPDNIYKEA